MYDIIRKKSTAYFVLFFRYDVELFMRGYIEPIAAAISSTPCNRIYEMR